MPKLSAFLVLYLMYNSFFSWWKRLLFYIRIFQDFLRKSGKNATATLLTFCTICISIFSSCWSSLHYLIYLVLNINYRGFLLNMNLYYWVSFSSEHSKHLVDINGYYIFLLKKLFSYIMLHTYKCIFHIFGKVIKLKCFRIL